MAITVTPLRSRSQWRQQALCWSLAATLTLSAGTSGAQEQDDLRAMVDRITEQGSPPVPATPSISPFVLEPVSPQLPELADTDDRLLVQADSGEVADPVSLEGDSIRLNFQDADIRALINTVSQVTGRNFVVDPRVKGRVTLVSGGPLDINQLYDVFLSVLEIHNFAAVDTGDLVKIVPSTIVKQHPTRTSVSGDVGSSDEQITQIYQLQHGSVQELVPILRPLLPPTSHFAAHPGSSTLVFTDTAANVARVLGIIESLDVPDRRSDIHVVFLRYAPADRMSQTLTQVATSLISQVTPGVPVKTISIQPDSAINALIIHAPEAEFLTLKALVDELDVPRPEAGNVHVVYLRYAKAADLVPILSEIAKPETTGGEEAPNEVPITVQADEDVNALVIKAEEETFNELKTVIEKLDLRRSQVFLETIIAEVSTNKAAEIGVEWQGLYQSSNGGEISVGTDFSDSAGGGVVVGVINDLVTDIAGNVVPDLNIVLRALRSDGNTNILATPNLLTLDNETSEIVVGQEVPFVTGQFVSDASSTTIVGGDGDDNTATGVVNPFQTIERKDVGLTLRITPQINEGGAIRMEIEQEISSVASTTVQGAADLITNRRSINATVLVDDGQIVVLGGLIQDDFQDTIEWIPVLGKIPLLGALFRKKTKTAVKRNLMVFLRPRIVRTPADIREQTQRLYETVRTQEESSLPDSRRLIPEEAKPPVLPGWEISEDPQTSIIDRGQK